MNQQPMIWDQNKKNKKEFQKDDIVKKPKFNKKNQKTHESIRVNSTNPLSE
jgi:hypothetical protein